jgi:hypothetical protein
VSNTYDVTSFELDYCREDVSKIATAIKQKASLLVIGMPGCGKSRLIDFLLHRPGVLERYGLSNNLKVVRVDGDIVATDARAMYSELLGAFGVAAQLLVDSLYTLKNQLLSQVRQLEREVDLAVVFDNFSQSLQQAMGEDFFTFLYALRNSRPRLNISYVFMANLKIDLNGFDKANRLFDKGVDRSICWFSLLNQKDTFFSIDRQWRKAGESIDNLGETDRQKMKERIYELAGGHALLNRYLSHLMLSGEISVVTEPGTVLKHGGIHVACETIWNDLEQTHKNYLVDMTKGNGEIVQAQDESIKELLTNYGVLKGQSFFSPLFENFVNQQEKASEVIGADCDDTTTKIIIKIVDDRELSFTLNGLSQKKRTLLCYLLVNQGETCTKDKLKDVGWPLDNIEGVPDQALSRQMDDIKGWLKRQKQLNQYLTIETVWGVGYKLVIKG